jgi:hypothetical protein
MKVSGPARRMTVSLSHTPTLALTKGAAAGFLEDEVGEGLGDEGFVDVRLEGGFADGGIGFQQAVLDGVADAVGGEGGAVGDGGLEEGQLGFVIGGCFGNHSHGGDADEVFGVVEERCDLGKVGKHVVIAAGIEGDQGSVAEAGVFVSEQFNERGRMAVSPAWKRLASSAATALRVLGMKMSSSSKSSSVERSGQGFPARFFRWSLLNWP